MILHLLLIISGKPEAAQIKALKVMVMNTVEAVDVASFAMRVFKWADDFNIFLINYFLQSLIANVSRFFIFFWMNQQISLIGKLQLYCSAH